MHQTLSTCCCVCLASEPLAKGRGMVRMRMVWDAAPGAHCLFSASLAAFKSLKYCVIAFAAALCSMMVGPLFAGLQVACTQLNDVCGLSIRACNNKTERRMLIQHPFWPRQRGRAHADEVLVDDWLVCSPVLCGGASLVDTSGFLRAELDSAATSTALLGLFTCHLVMKA